MKERARKMVANAVVGMDLTSGILNGVATLLSSYGTAVVDGPLPHTCPSPPAPSPVVSKVDGTVN